VLGFRRVACGLHVLRLRRVAYGRKEKKALLFSKCVLIDVCDICIQFTY
jgi:hypothetical protein